MPGAIIVTNQPAGAGLGTAGESRTDLWLSQPVNLSVGVGGNTSYSWELLSSPPGSAATLSTPSASTSSWTPDVRGTYRIRLVTNGGGPGNLQTRVFRVTKNSSGVTLGRGWAAPALGEKLGESIRGSIDRGYADAIETILSDAEAGLLALTASTTDLALHDTALDNAVKYREVCVFSGSLKTLFTGFTRVNAFYLDLSKYPASLGSLTRTARLRVVVSATGAVGNTATKWVAEVRLYDVTHGVVVGSTTLSPSPSGDVLTPSVVTSGLLTIGAVSGNLRSDTATVYSLDVRAKGTGSLAAPDYVFLHHAELILEYT